VRKRGRACDSAKTYDQSHADQRYYNSNAGRLYTPDPSGMANVDMLNPTSWNMYAYANGDPVYFNDPTGLDCASTPHFSRVSTRVR
jgi:RHS repeat-associated protein